MQSSLNSLAISLFDLTAIAVLLGLIAGIFVFAFEELTFRQFYNRFLIRFWYRRHGSRHMFRGFSRYLFALPYKQMTGAIATMFQVVDVPQIRQNKNEFESVDLPERRHSLLNEFAIIGANVLGIPGPVVIDWIKAKNTNAEMSENEYNAPRLLFLAERALDDLQAELATRWTRMRYLLALVAIVSVFLAVYVLRDNSNVNLGFLGSVVAYPLVFALAALFAPIFRDFVERLSGGVR
jgi:uncharacterized integral membrane protein